MIVGDGNYELQGTEAQKAILAGCFTPGDPNFIAFPWGKLSPPSTPIPIGWMDLNAAVRDSIRWANEERVRDPDYRVEAHPHSGHPGGKPFFTEGGALLNPVVEVNGELDPRRTPGHVHVHDEHGNEGHGIIRKVTGRYWVAGVFWTDGRIYVDTRCQEELDVAREVVSAELAHSVDYFLPLSDGQKNALMGLWHPGGLDPHSWWEIHDYGSEYYTLGGEAFMAAFTLAYSSITPDQSAFEHKTRPEQAAKVRAILGVHKVGAPTLGETVVRVGQRTKFHRTTCPFVRVARAFGRPTSEHARADAIRRLTLSPCKVCKP
jgi:hypothetical protein